MPDLRSSLKQVQKMDEHQGIAAELDWNEETSVLNYTVGQLGCAPALLEENIRDAAPGFRALDHLFGTGKVRVAAAFGCPIGKTVSEQIQLTMANFGRKMPPDGGFGGSP